ncbi:MAG: type V CRISPR-associated protein Cas4 [Candidatus Marinimicrobia bacterium]|nr:type V CRISPR-associated protein Cas4 [Candidatus Neomarinimicrobiota bacterium]
METYIPISYLNDFIFCPRSIYFHQCFGRSSKRLYHSTDQIDGLTAHKTIDKNTYSTSKETLQGLEIYSEKYNLCGKIDIYDSSKYLLIERKKKIKVIYDGYIFQLFAQYFCLIEMGYKVEHLKLYSMDDNKSHPIPLPKDDEQFFNKFEALIETMKSFSLKEPFVPNKNKCTHCIYHTICDVSAC